MQLLFDHLIATVVGTVLLIAVALAATGRSEDVRDSTRYYAAKNHQTALADMLQRDLLNIGAGLPFGDPMITAVAEDSVTFYTAINGVGTPELITYRRVVVGSTDHGDPLYEVRRYVGDGPGRRHDGTGLLVTRFEINLADASGGAVTTAAAASTVRTATVRIENVMPYAVRARHGTAPMARNYWEATYRPPNLARGW